MDNLQELREFLVNCSIETRAMDVSENKSYYLVVTPTGKYARVSEHAYIMLTEFLKGRDAAYIKDVLEHKTEKRVDVTQVESFLEHIVNRLMDIDRREDRSLINAIWLKFNLIPARVTGYLARHMQFLFDKNLVLVLLPILLVIYGSALMKTAGTLPHLHPQAYALGVFLGLISVVVHELGHATAASRYGAHVGDIGIGIYLRYPVMYSDVTDVWRLRRWQRVIVDLGGVYFQVIVAALYAMMYYLFKEPTVTVALWLIAGSLFMSLNPIFKFDTYWVLSDMLGVTNLSSVPFRMAKHAIERLQGKTTDDIPWESWLIVVLGVYSVFYFIVWFFMLSSLLFFVASIVRDIVHLSSTLPDINYTTISWHTLVNNAFSISKRVFFKLTAFVLILYFMTKQARMLIKARRQRLAATETR